jgi:membrane-associated protein
LSVISIWLLLVGAAVIGSQIGFLTGNKLAGFLQRQDGRFLLSQKYITVAQAFCNKHRVIAFVMSRFLPMIRTFMPIAAGAVGVDKRQFLFFNVFGAVLWVSVMLFSGYWLGLVFPVLENFIGVIPVSITVITSMVVMIDLVKGMK